MFLNLELIICNLRLGLFEQTSGISSTLNRNLGVHPMISANLGRYFPLLERHQRTKSSTSIRNEAQTDVLNTQTDPLGMIIFCSNSILYLRMRKTISNQVSWLLEQSL